MMPTPIPESPIPTPESESESSFDSDSGVGIAPGLGITILFILSGHQIISELRPSEPQIILLADSRDMDSRSKVLLMDGHTE